MATALVYGPLHGNHFTNTYFTTPTDTIYYPDSNSYTVQGTTYLPSIYAKDLDTLEVASSGKIAFTLNDSNVLDLWRGQTNNTAISTVNNYESLAIQANNSNVYLNLDATASNLTLYASNAVNVLASNNVGIVSATGVLDGAASNGIYWRSSNLINNYAGLSMFTGINDCNVFTRADGTSNTYMVYSSNNFDVLTSNAATITSVGKQTLVSTLADVEAHAGVHAYVHAESNVSVVASNDLFLYASNAIHMRSKTLDIYTSNSATIASDGTLAFLAQNKVIISDTNSNAYVSAEGASCNVFVYALSNVQVTASNDINAVATGTASIKSTTESVVLSVAADSNVRLSLNTIDFSAALHADSNVTVSSGAGSISLYSFSNLAATASNAASLVAISDVAIRSTTSKVVLAAAENSNVSLTLSTADYSASLAADSNVSLTSATGTFSAYSSNNLTLTTSNAAVVQSVGDVTVQSQLGVGTMQAAGTSLVLTSGTQSAALAAAATVTIAASNLVQITSDSNIQATALSNVVLRAVTGYVDVQASNSVLVASPGVVSIASSTSNVSIAASNDVSIGASNDLNVAAVAAYSLTATDISNTSSSSTSNVSSNSYFISAASNLVLASSTFANLSAASNMGLYTDTGRLTFATATSNVLMTFDPADYSASLVASSNIAITASNDLSLYSGRNLSVTAASLLKLSTTDSNAYVSIDHTTATAILYGESNARLVSSSNAYVTATSNLFLSAANSGVTMTFDKDCNILYGANTLVGEAKVSHAFNVDGSNTMTVSKDRVTINGNLDIMGVINNIAATTTDLLVEDKYIKLSRTSNAAAATYDSIVQDAGIIVDTFPIGVDSNTVQSQKQYEKSFKWNYGTAGIDSMLTAPGLSNEAFWELKGGNLRLTSVRTDGKEISYGLRINEIMELEMYQKVTTATDTTFKRIAKFGRAMPF